MLPRTTIRSNSDSSSTVGTACCGTNFGTLGGPGTAIPGRTGPGRGIRAANRSEIAATRMVWGDITTRRRSAPGRGARIRSRGPATPSASAIARQPGPTVKSADLGRWLPGSGPSLSRFLRWSACYRLGDQAIARPSASWLWLCHARDHAGAAGATIAFASRGPTPVLSELLLTCDLTRMR